jgi:hypothetical protein
MNRKLFSYAILMFLILMSVSACGDSPTSRNSEELTVDSLFLEFYENLGGVDNLGIPISPKFIQAGVAYQYTAAALMAYDVRLPTNLTYFLAPIGMEMDITEMPSDIDFPEGHAIHPEFQAIFEQMGKSYFTGLPLTAGRYNPERGGVEQYFENVGFYHLDSDLPGEIHLLQYGAWLCASSCDYDSPQNAVPVLSYDAEYLSSDELGYAKTGTAIQNSDDVAIIEDPTSKSVTLTLTTWKDQETMTSKGRQTIFASVQNGDSQPITNLEPIIILTVPTQDEGTRIFVYNFPPANRSDGVSSLSIDPIGARNGTQVKYQICPWNGAHESLCVHDSFLIWGNP